MTMDMPAQMLDTKKNTGRYWEYHSGCSFEGAMVNKRAQGRLVQRGQDHAQDGQGQGHLDHDVADLLQAQPFEQGGREFDEQHGQVEHDAQTHLEEQGRGALLDEDGVGQPPGTADVVAQGEDHQGVAQEGGQDGRGGPRRGIFSVRRGSRRRRWCIRPRPRATPHIRSKPIQMPHGLFWSRLVTAPRPPVKRITVTTRPAMRMTVAIRLNGVKRDFFATAVVSTDI